MIKLNPDTVNVPSQLQGERVRMSTIYTQHADPDNPLVWQGTGWVQFVSWSFSKQKNDEYTAFAIKFEGLDEPIVFKPSSLEDVDMRFEVITDGA